jgi:predicted transcriptional regulator
LLKIVDFFQELYYDYCQTTLKENTGCVWTIAPQDSVYRALEIMALFTEKRMRHLPVLEMEKLVGLVSIGDAVKQYLADKDLIIQQLENYITGCY